MFYESILLKLLKDHYIKEKNRTSNRHAVNSNLSLVSIEETRADFRILNNSHFFHIQNQSELESELQTQW